MRARLGSRPAVLAYLIAAASCLPSATSVASSAAGALSFLSARSFPGRLPSLRQNVGEFFHLSCVWSRFDVDRDRPAGANHVAQTLPRRGLVDEIGDGPAGQSGGCIFGRGLYCRASPSGLRATLTAGTTPGKLDDPLLDAGNIPAGGRNMFPGRGVTHAFIRHIRHKMVKLLRLLVLLCVGWGWGIRHMCRMERHLIRHSGQSRRLCRMEVSHIRHRVRFCIYLSFRLLCRMSG